jgi:hypothetical protein
MHRYPVEDSGGGFMTFRRNNVIAAGLAAAACLLCLGQSALADDVVVVSHSAISADNKETIDLLRAKLAFKIENQLKYGSLWREEGRYLSDELNGVTLTEGQMVAAQGGLTSVDSQVLMKKISFIADQLNMELRDRLFAGKVQNRGAYSGVY